MIFPQKENGQLGVKKLKMFDIALLSTGGNRGVCKTKRLGVV